MRLTRQQARQIDHDCVSIYSMPTIVLMENAARAVAAVAKQLLGEKRNVLILCGGGNNGGDGLAAARHLHNFGCTITIGLTADPDKYTGDAKVNWQIVQAMNLHTTPADVQLIEAGAVDLIIDAIFGTGLDRPPRPPFDDLAAAINRSGKPVLAVDVPSGLDCDTGQPLGPCVRASTTVTFVAEKVGFERATAWVGQVQVADIGCPAELLGDRIDRTLHNPL